MDFRVLGPMHITSDEGTTVHLSATKPRLVLGRLLLSANVTVDDKRLFDVLWWGRTPPRSATANLRTHVHTLRKTLGLDATGGPPTLATRAGGYRLEIEAGSLDLQSWHRLVGEGRAALRRGDLTDGVGCLERALALWRGRLLDDSGTGGPFQGAAADLDEQRIDVLEDLGDAKLAQGRHAELVVQLRASTREHPWRERLVGQLLIALHGSGRQADALNAYREFRSRLGDDLGLEPSAALQRLHQAILRDDAGLYSGDQGSVVRVVARPGPVPAQLPRDAPDFTGRHVELRTITEHVGSGTVVIDGMVGVGTLTLAVHTGHHLIDRFPDGQLYVDLHHGHGAGRLEVLRRFLRAFGTAESHIPDEAEEAAALFRSTVAGRRILMVLDNPRDEDQVRMLLPGGLEHGVLVASDRTLPRLPVAHRLHLRAFSPAEAVEMLDRIVGGGRVRAELRAARGIAHSCGYLPLALRIVGTRLATRPSWSLRGMATRLARPSGCLDELESAGIGVRTQFDVIHRMLRDGDVLGRAAADALPAIGMFDTDMTAPAVARRLGASLEQAERLLDRLIDAHLVEGLDLGRYRMHPLMRLYARECAGRPGQEAIA